MGVCGLYSFLKPKSQTVKLNDLIVDCEPQKIAIDISYYIYKWQANSDRVISFLTQLKDAGHSVLLIFDGKASNSKQDESIRRKELRDTNIQQANTLKEQIKTNNTLNDEQIAQLEKIIHQYERRGWQCSREERHAFKRHLYEHKIPILKCKGEADWLLTSLSMYDKVDIVISGDMDLLVLGTKVQYVPIYDGTSFHVFHRDQILSELDITDTQFRSFCAMCSSEKEERLDIRSAYHGIRIYKTIKNLKLVHESWLSKWPTLENQYLLPVSEPETWIREDELDRYIAWETNVPMPYIDTNSE
jgi:hypothetical protein